MGSTVKPAKNSLDSFWKISSRLILVGILWMSLSVFSSRAFAIPLSTDTPTDTPTLTPTETSTETPTETPTNTPTTTTTVTSTPQGPVNLGTAGAYIVLAGSTITSTGPTTLCGDLGLFPGSAVTGSPTIILACGGVSHINDGSASTAQDDLTTAYLDAKGRTGAVTLSASSYDYVSGSTVTPGVYYTGSTLDISGSVTLDGQGDPNAVFIFQVGSALNVDGSSSIILIGGANAANVYWQVTSSATINTGASFKGTILALFDINILTGATLEGRALARNGQVTLDSISSGLATPTTTPTRTPTSTPTGTATPTVTPTASFDSGALVLAPVPARQGEHVILFFDAVPAATRWEIFNVAGERVAALSFDGPHNHFWETTGVAPGVYFVRIQITYLSGTKLQIIRKAVVIR